MGTQTVITIEQEVQIAEEVIDELKELSVAPRPECYEVWYEHKRNRSRPLSRKIEILSGRNDGISTESLKKLHHQFFRAHDVQKRLGEFLDSVNLRADDLMDITGDFLASNESFSNDLTDCENQLKDGENGREDAKAVITTLLQGIAETKQRNKQLEDRLTDAQSEIGKLQDIAKEFEIQSFTDALTGLSNRRYFDLCLLEEIEQQGRNKLPLSLIICDIDHFKKFNDKWGHDVGDQVLRLVAHVLSENTKGQDLVCRFGGEEFIILLPETTQEDAVILADKIRLAVSKRRLKSKKSQSDLGNVHMSFGVSLYKDHMTSEDFIKRADDGLYRAKDEGRNRVVCLDFIEQEKDNETRRVGENVFIDV